MNTMQQFSLDLARVRDLLSQSGLTENGRGAMVRTEWWFMDNLTDEQREALGLMREQLRSLLEAADCGHSDDALVELASLEEDFDWLISEVGGAPLPALVREHTLEETLAHQWNRFMWGGMSVADVDEGLARCVALFGGTIGEEHREPLRAASAMLWEDRRQRMVPNVGPVDTIAAVARVAGNLLTPNGAESDIPVVAEVFRQAVEELDRQGYTEMRDVQLLVDERAEDGGDRQYAYCLQTADRKIAVAFAPRARHLPKHNVRGLVYHELGHALEFEYGVEEMERALGCRLPDDVEQRADMIAEHAFGVVIRYDRRLVQCTGRGCRGTSPRPAVLR